MQNPRNYLAALLSPRSIWRRCSHPRRLAPALRDATGNEAAVAEVSAEELSTQQATMSARRARRTALGRQGAMHPTAAAELPWPRGTRRATRSSSRAWMPARRARRTAGSARLEGQFLLQRLYRPSYNKLFSFIINFRRPVHP